MAIQIDLQNTLIGIPFQAVYFRILSAHVRYSCALEDRREIELWLSGYASPPSADGVAPIATRSYTASLADIGACAGDNIIAKCYAWVMAQPDMAGCVEV